MADHKANIVIQAKDQATKTINSVTKNIVGMASKAGGAVAAMYALGKAIKYSIGEAIGQEKATTKLNLALANNGLYTQEASKHTQDFASEMQKMSSFADNEVSEAMATLVMQTKRGGWELENLTKATADLAAGLGMDLNSAAQLLGKTVGGQTNMLARYGITVDGAAGSSERLKSVTDGVASVFQGAASASTQSMEGKFKQLQMTIGDTAEKIGFIFTPALLSLASVINDKIFTNDKVSRFITNLNLGITTVVRNIKLVITSLKFLGSKTMEDDIRIKAELVAINEKYLADVKQAQEGYYIYLNELQKKQAGLNNKKMQEAKASKAAIVDETEALKKLDELNKTMQDEQDKETKDAEEADERDKQFAEQREDRATRSAKVVSDTLTELTEKEKDNAAQISEIVQEAAKGDAEAIVEIIRKKILATLTMQMAEALGTGNFPMAAMIGAQMGVVAGTKVKFHTGGVVGQTDGMRVPGGEPDERAIIAKVGERVVPTGGSRGQSAQPINVSVKIGERELFKIMQTIDKKGKAGLL